MTLLYLLKIYEPIIKEVLAKVATQWWLINGRLH